MKIIEKIEIIHFRSFLGSPSPYKTEISSLKDLNIFSGSNDSGKSNIFRALNLFFNNEVSHGMPFDFERDFFLGKKQGTQKVIEIKVSFNLSRNKRDKFLPDKFSISKFYDRNGFRNELYVFRLKELGDKEIRIDSRVLNNKDVWRLFTSELSSTNDLEKAKKREWNYRVKFAGFLNKGVSFEYIPAIRDRNFFTRLFGRVITQIKNNEGKRIDDLKHEKERIVNWKESINLKSISGKDKKLWQDENYRNSRCKEIEISIQNENRIASAISALEKEINLYSDNLIKSVNFLDSEFKVGKDLQDFFEGFEIGTGSEKLISLNVRGDGIQAKFVPKILDFISTLEGKKYFLWGFEEPENSAEYKNQNALAKELKEIFSSEKQIFLTTHSEEFLQLHDGPEIDKQKRTTNLYHVKKFKDPDYGEYSQIFLFDADKNDFDLFTPVSSLHSDLGESHLRAKYSKELKQLESAFLEKQKKIQSENDECKKMITQTAKPMVFVEDECTELYKIAWLMVFSQKFTIENFPEVFEQECPFAIFPSGGASSLAGFLRASKIDHLSNKKIIGIFDFDEEGKQQFKSVKSTLWDSSKGFKTEGIYKKRNDHTCFYALLIPVPATLEKYSDLNYSSYVEIENLISSSFLEKNNLIKSRELAGGAVFSEVTDNGKIRIRDKLLSSLSLEDLINFKPLFTRLYQLLDLKLEKK